MTTTCTQHDWIAPGGEHFSYSRWSPVPTDEAKPLAILVAVHGLSGAAADYEPLGAHLARLGVVTYAIELRGQGNDPLPDRRGDLESLDVWFADLTAFFAQMRAQHPDGNFYYYGESMGAALLTRFLAQASSREQPAGLILASPVVEMPTHPSWWQEIIFGFFIWVAPRHRIDVSKYTKRTDPADRRHWVTRDEAHRQWFAGSSHKITRFTVRFFHNLRLLISGCFDAAPRVTPPVLVVYAAHDVYIKPARVEAFVARLGSKEKEHVLFPDSYHLLLHDFDRAQALTAIETWLLRRIELTAGRNG